MSLNYTGFSVLANGGVVELRFPGKPSEAIRTTLKRNGYRWSPSSQCWWSRTTRYADFVAALDRQMTGKSDLNAWHAPDVDALYEDQCREACGL